MWPFSNNNKYQVRKKFPIKLEKAKMSLLVQIEEISQQEIHLSYEKKLPLEEQFLEILDKTMQLTPIYQKKKGKRFYSGYKFKKNLSQHDIHDVLEEITKSKVFII